MLPASRFSIPGLDDWVEIRATDGVAEVVAGPLLLLSASDSAST